MMPTKNNLSNKKPGNQIAPAYDALAQVSALEQNWLDTEDENTVHLLLTDGMKLLNQAIEIFYRENEPIMATWTSLQKASIMGDLARAADSTLRSELTREALELAGKAIEVMPDDHPPNLAAATKLYLTMIEILVKIRAVLERSEQVEALDELIRGVSAHFGEVQALDLSVRNKAYDLFFTAQMLDTLVEIEKDPQQRKHMITSSRDLASQAYQLLQFSTAVKLTPVGTLLRELEYKLNQETVPERIVCAQCGTENPPEANTCSQCHTPLVKENP